MFVFNSPDGDRGCDWTKSRAERAQAFTAEGKHVTGGVWSQSESHGEPLIAFITFSQIKMSTSGKNSVPLCSLVIRGPVSHQASSLEAQRWTEAKRSAACLFGTGDFSPFQIFFSPRPFTSIFCSSQTLSFPCFSVFFFNHRKIYISNRAFGFFSAELPKSTERHNIVCCTISELLHF